MRRAKILLNSKLWRLRAKLSHWRRRAPWWLPGVVVANASVTLAVFLGDDLRGAAIVLCCLLAIESLVWLISHADGPYA